MKKKTTSRSAFFNLRALSGVLLLFFGILLALFAFDGLAYSGNDNNQAANSSGWLTRFASSVGLHLESQKLAGDAGQPGQIQTRGGGSSIALTQSSGKTEPEASQSASNAPYTGPHNDFRPVEPVHTQPLRDLPAIPAALAPHREIPEPIRPPPPDKSGGPETARQTFSGPVLSAPTAAGLNFDGVGVGLAGFAPASNPPDTEGRVGATQYVQWNNTSFAVFNKTTGALIYGPVAGNTLFQSLGGACASHNDGDPVVAYDIMSGRWVLSQFVVGASPSYSHQCVAVSVTQDASGAYYLYDFVTDTTNFVDYPHIGVWPDGYYMTAHVFNAAGTAQVASRVYVFERTQMIQGLAARMVQADLSKKSNRFQYGFLPADLDSLTPPPTGEAAFVLGPDPAFTSRTDSTRVAVTWGATPTITLTEATVAVGITSAPCDSNTAAQDNRDCVPQPSPAVATDDLDNVSSHYMYRLAYRNFGGSPVQESLVVNGTTAGGTSTPAHGAIRWFEFRNAGNSTATPTSFQAATFDPDSAYRWMGSAAMDKDHNIAIGYSKSYTNVLPSIWINGRLGTDTVNTLGTEAQVQAGAGVQLSTAPGGTAGNRWGDYSAMTIDPVDQCTFWYTNEYLKTNGGFNWSTRIATYRFPSCTNAAAWGTVTGTITSTATGAPISGVTVTLNNGFAAASAANGVYSISVPAGSYTATAADSARNCTTASPASASVAPPSGGSVTQNFTMAGASKLEANGITIDDSTSGGNANGIVNRSECVKLNVGLKNNGCATETAISATLSTTTPGVTVIDNSASYPNMVIDASGTNSVPFRISTSSTFVCGTNIALSLNLTYASGSKTIALSVPTCAGGANQTIPTTSITLSDPSQPDRLGRDGNPSTCAGKACPGAINTAGTRNYKTFSFTNTGGAAACFTVTINAALGGGGDIQSAAYLNTYTPPIAQGDAAGNLCLNYLGDSGVSGLGTTLGTASYSFTVPALSNFVIVVGTATGSTTSSQFSGTVSGFVNNTAGPGACATPTPTPTATPTPTPSPTPTPTPTPSPTPTPTPTPSPTPTPTPNAPVLTSAASSLTHTGVGPFSMNMPLNGSGVEPRDGGGSYSIVLAFDSPIDGGTATVTSGTGTAGAPSFNGNTMTVSVTGVTDQQVITLTVSNVHTVNGGTLPSASINLGFLIGDTNSDREVNVGDTIQVRSHAGVVNGSTFQYDLNLDGQIDVGDTTVVRSKAGDFVP